MTKNPITAVKNTNRVVEIPQDILLPSALNAADIGRRSHNQRNKMKTRNIAPGVLNNAQSVNKTVEVAIVEGRINFANLPVFANNAAAVSGNLAVGRLYKTAAGALNVVV